MPEKTETQILQEILLQLTDLLEKIISDSTSQLRYKQDMFDKINEAKSKIIELSQPMIIFNQIPDDDKEAIRKAQKDLLTFGRAVTFHDESGIKVLHPFTEPKGIGEKTLYCVSDKANAKLFWKADD